MSRGHRIAVLMLALALLASMQIYGTEPALAATDGKLVLVLDSSGSMKEKVGGQSKISIAKRALTTVIGKLPADAQVGMRVYGATVFARKDKGACTDSQLVVPIGTDNRDRLRSAVARYKPYGETPISYSLKQAAADLGGSGRRTVVLVSDGEETCDADPCATAAALAQKGIDLKFDVIGLGVSGRARSQLKCVADKGNGTYYDADNAEQIQDSLDKLATRAFRPFRLSGLPVRGSTAKAAAPVIRPGQYVDHFPGGSGDLFYTIPRTIPGSTIHVGFTAEAAGLVPTVYLHIYGSSPVSCGTGLGQVGNTGGTRNVVSTELSSWRSQPDDDCNTSATMIIQITHNDALAGRSFELLVAEEPPLASDRDLPPAEDRVEWQRMTVARNGAPAPVPGSSFSDEPMLTEGTYRTSVLTGEKQVFGIHLDWGQRLQVQALVPPRRGALARALGPLDTLSVQLVSPMRGSFVGIQPPSGMPTNSVYMADDNETYRAGAGTPTIAYLNRAQVDARGDASLPGTYSVVVSKSRWNGEKQFLVPYILVIKVIGTPGSGAPQYQQPSPTPGPTSSTPSATPTSAPSNSASSAPTSAPSSTPRQQNGIGVGTVVGVGAGALVLGALAAAAVAVGLRRRRR